MTAADHPMPDHYVTLQVEPDADMATIRGAYLRLMRDSHPDLHHGDPVATAAAQRINAAYTVLGDPAARATYDRLRAAANHARTGFSPNPVRATAGSGPQQPGPWLKGQGVTGQGATGQGVTGQGVTGQGVTGQGVTGQGVTGRGGVTRQAYSREQHEVRAAFHTASVRVGVALFAVGAVLLVALSLG